MVPVETHVELSKEPSMVRVPARVPVPTPTTVAVERGWMPSTAAPVALVVTAAQRGAADALQNYLHLGHGASLFVGMESEGVPSNSSVVPVDFSIIATTV